MGYSRKGVPLFYVMNLHIVFFLDTSTRCCCTETMNDPYIKLIKEKEREKKSYFARARSIVKAFAKNIPFPLEQQIEQYRTPRSDRLDAVLEYLCDTYISQKHETIKPKEKNERLAKR